LTRERTVIAVEDTAAQRSSDWACFSGSRLPVVKRDVDVLRFCWGGLGGGAWWWCVHGRFRRGGVRGFGEEGEREEAFYGGMERKMERGGLLEEWEGNRGAAAVSEGRDWRWGGE